MTTETIRKRLIIFTRYPEPGHTKTRMIPALGAEGSAGLQRQMAEHTLVQVRKVQAELEVHFAGGSQRLMQDWLGADLTYQQQSEGDLGQRMKSAFEVSFADGINRTVMVGVDCPDINTTIIAEAFDALEQQDLVLGPAADGGYYLIGLKCLIPELFLGINWGTSQVLAKTQSIAQKLGLTVYYLPLLEDVDRPEDLAIWERYHLSSTESSRRS